MHTDHPQQADRLRPLSTGSPARRPRTLRMRHLTTLGVVATAGIAFAACGGSSGASSTSTTAPTANASTTPRTVPGANGTIAAVTGTSLEVQNTQTGQTTVNYTPTTTIRQISPTTLSAVTVGTCINAVGKPTTASTSTTSPFGRPVTATTVSISQPVSGACTRGGTAGRPGGFGGGNGGTSGTRPGGGTFRPPAGRNFAGGAFATAFGSVTSVTPTTVTVSETNPRTSQTSSVVVTVTPTTTYSTTQTATAAAIVVGQCARAVGPADSTGAVTASSLTVSTPTNGVCGSGFGFRGAFGGGQGANPGAAPGA